VRLSPLGTSAPNCPGVQAPDEDECGAVGGMRIGMGKPNYLKKTSLVSLCSPQIPHDLIRVRTRAAAVGNPIPRSSST
jgi:hypothetical protein